MQITEDEFTRALANAYRMGYRNGYVNSRTDAVSNVYDPEFSATNTSHPSCSASNTNRRDSSGS